MRKEILGIVAAAALMLTGTAFAADASQAAFTGEQLAQAQHQNARVRVKSARLRAQPDPKSHRIDSLRRGTRVQVLDSSGDWTHVRIGKHDGYVQSSLLTM
jgi:hypothetical protein